MDVTWQYRVWGRRYFVDAIVSLDRKGGACVCRAENGLGGCGSEVSGYGRRAGREPSPSNWTKSKFYWKPSTTPRPAAGESEMGRGPLSIYRLGPTHTRASITGESTLLELLLLSRVVPPGVGEPSHEFRGLCIFSKPLKYKTITT